MAHAPACEGRSRTAALQIRPRVRQQFARRLRIGLDPEQPAPVPEGPPYLEGIGVVGAQRQRLVAQLRSLVDPVLRRERVGHRQAGAPVRHRRSADDRVDPVGVRCLRADVERVRLVEAAVHHRRALGLGERRLRPLPRLLGALDQRPGRRARGALSLLANLDLFAEALADQAGDLLDQAVLNAQDVGCRQLEAGALVVDAAGAVDQPNADPDSSRALLDRALYQGPDRERARDAVREERCRSDRARRRWARSRPASERCRAGG